MNRLILAFFLLAFQVSSAFAAKSLRIGELAYGTLDWELATIRKQKLDEKYHFELEMRPLANAQAGKIALQSGAVDVIVSDWVWVSRQRNEGANYTFSPYSSTSGALMVAADSPIKQVQDLSGKRIGIAGGELDKNWLLLRALGEERQIDLDATVEKVYGAPPLLNQQLMQGNLDAILTYWHYAARLEAQGYREVLNGESILAALGIEPPLPTLGYVFSADWAQSHPQLIVNFLAASREAKNLLCESDPAWAEISSLTRTEDPAVQNRFRQKYCAGRIHQWGEAHHKLAAKVFTLLHEIAGKKLTGPSTELAPGTFWNE